MAQRTCFEFSLKITFPQSVNEAYMTSQIIMVSMFVHKTKVHRQYLRHSSSQEPLSPGFEVQLKQMRFFSCFQVARFDGCQLYARGWVVTIQLEKSRLLQLGPARGIQRLLPLILTYQLLNLKESFSLLLIQGIGL